MSRYRRVYTCLWGDGKFQTLSRPQPCGQSLWIYLLTGDKTTNIPGLLSIGLGGLADAMKWPVPATRKAWNEIATQKMATADWEAPLIFVRNALHYNIPESPNVVKSWRTNWVEIPECPLKLIAYEQMEAFFKEYGEAFVKAFREACARPLAKPFGKPLAKGSAKSSAKP